MGGETDGNQLNKNIYKLLMELNACFPEKQTRRLASHLQTFYIFKVDYMYIYLQGKRNPGFCIIPTRFRAALSKCPSLLSITSSHFMKSYLLHDVSTNNKK